MDRSKILPIILSATILAACNSGPDKLHVSEDTPVNDIIAAAQAEVRAGNGTEGGDYYLEVERLYPYTPEAERALILAAQAYHDDGALVESRVAASRYLQFFPGSPDADLAQYLVALSYYDGIVDVTRDQERTFEALKALQAVIDNYPNSEYAKLAEPKFTIALNQLAGKEMEIGRYYLARGYYVAAIARFKAVISEYPNNIQQPEAYHRLIEAYYALGLRQEAQRTFEAFSNFDKENEWYQRSGILLSTGTQPDAGGTIINRVLTGDWQ